LRRDTVRHTFFKVFGIKPFDLRMSNPDGIDVNLRRLKTRPRSLLVVRFDR